MHLDTTFRLAFQRHRKPNSHGTGSILKDECEGHFYKMDGLCNESCLLLAQDQRDAQLRSEALDRLHTVWLFPGTHEASLTHYYRRAPSVRCRSYILHPCCSTEPPSYFDYRDRESWS